MVYKDSFQIRDEKRKKCPKMYVVSTQKGVDHMLEKGKKFIRPIRQVKSIKEAIRYLREGIHVILIDPDQVEINQMREDYKIEIYRYSKM